jgi:hypothetical protein
MVYIVITGIYVVKECFFFIPTRLIFMTFDVYLSIVFRLYKKGSVALYM